TGTQGDRFLGILNARSQQTVNLLLLVLRVELGSLRHRLGVSQEGTVVVGGLQVWIEFEGAIKSLLGVLGTIRADVTITQVVIDRSRAEPGFDRRFITGDGVLGFARGGTVPTIALPGVIAPIGSLLGREDIVFYRQVVVRGVGTPKLLQDVSASAQGGGVGRIALQNLVEVR